MSGNQKQAAAVGPQNQARYTQAPYLQRPPTPQRTEYHVTAQSAYVSQQPQGQTGSQGPPTLRGIAPTGPPNQSSTPPSSDLKVQQMPQQSINITYVPQGAVRTNSYYHRSTAPPAQGVRMPTNHRQGQQPIYPQAAAQYVQMTQPYIITPPPPFYNGAPRQGYVSQPFQMIPGQSNTLFYQPTQAQPQYYYNPINLPRPGPPPVAAAQQTPTQQPPPNIPLAPTLQQHPIAKTNKRRAKAIPIIDPNTGVDKLTEMYEQDNSHPPSGESSARQTPQPLPPNPNKEVQATFAKQVAQAISNDETLDENEHIPTAAIEHQEITMYPSQSIHNTNRYEHLAHTSKLQIPLKEFVPSNQNPPKEVTPIVSANVDTVEVTIPNKPPKERESPAKLKKAKEQSSKEHSRDSIKEVPPPKEVVDKPAVFGGVKDDKESSMIVGSSNLNPTVPFKESKDVPIVMGQRDEKKTQKRDKVEAKPSVNSQEAVEIAFSPPPVAPQDSSIGKSKQNAAQRSKEAQKQSPVPQQQLNQKPAPVAVPASQPAKPNNRTNKMKELNMKGATKEGTDMDAFNDNVTVTDIVNANVTNTTVPVPNDNYNINNIQLISNNETAVNDKKTESNESQTIKTELKTLPKGKIDVTDIVKDVPKPIKPFVAPVETQDEPDRAAFANEKLVQAKNEVNSKPSSESGDSNINDTKISLPYREGQWTPLNTSGEKVYDRDFLLALRDVPKSRVKPESIPIEVVLTEDRGRVGDMNRFHSGRTDFAPNFNASNFSGKSSSRSGVPKRGSQQGKINSSSQKGGKPNVIRVSISVREDVKLHESENAWRPARLNSGGQMTEDEKKTAELYRKVRGVLNKLTPQKFDTLVSQVRTLQIDTNDRLQGVIDLVFEKAVDEPNFSVAYALMCRELALMQVPASNDGKKRDGEYVNFRKLLVTRCQMEFEKNSVDEGARNERLKEIEACTDPEKKKELQLQLEEDDRRIRMKSVGNIRFIGELFKQQMLTVNIMMRCLNNLLDNKEEESLECLCKLLTTIGKELEVTKNVDLSAIFNTMKEIVDKKHGKISSRVRFMLQDVIDLRRNKWVPRRQDSNPKTIDQIQKEAEHEQLNIQAMNSVPITPRKDDRNSNSLNADRKRRNVTDDSGWSTATSRNRQTFTVHSDKLKNKPPQIDEPLGSIQMYSTWVRGSNIKTPQTTLPPNTNNMYAALENVPDTDKRPLSSRPNSKAPYSSKGPSLERSYKYEEGRSSRSGSQHRSGDSSVTSSQSNLSTIVPTVPKPGQVPQSNPVITDVYALERKIKNILEEYLNDCCRVDECDKDIRESIPSSHLPKLVSDGCLNVLERSNTARLKTGSLFAQLIKLGTLSEDNYCSGLEELLAQADDLIIDIPKVWDYLAEIIAPLLFEETLSFNKLHSSFEILIEQGHAPKLLAPLFKLVVKEKGPNFLHNLWRSSNASLSSFMPPDKVDSFVKDNEFEFLLGGSSLPVFQCQLSHEEIHEKLLQLFRDNVSFDDTVKWISVNVGDRVQESKFIRTLAAAIFESSIERSKLNEAALEKKFNYLLRYVDRNPAHELQCLYALQAVVNKLEHPSGLLCKICNILYESSVISQESFISWEKSTDPAEQEGKGVSLLQLTSFFNLLKENDDEYDEGSSTSDDGA